jgi:lysophospholipase
VSKIDKEPPTLDKYLKTPDGALLRYRHWKPTTTSDIKPHVLLLPGRATALEKLDAAVEILRERGYGVWALDWRGQGLSTREAGKRGYIQSYEIYLRDLDLFIRNFLKTDYVRRPVVMLAHSMGGHIGLRYMAENPGIIDGAVLTAPMLDINTGLYSRHLARWLSNFMVRLGFGKSYVYTQGDYNPVTQPFEGNILTHNQEAFYYHRHLQIANPDIVVGGVTFGWIKATLDSIENLNSPQKLGQINVPVKIYAAGEERVVDNTRIEQIVDWIPQCELEIIQGARHELLAEVISVKTRIFNGFDRFVQQNFDLPIIDQPYKETLVSKTIQPLKDLTPLPISIHPDN